MDRKSVVQTEIILNMYFVRHILAIGALKSTKSAIIARNKGNKIQNWQFWGQFCVFDQHFAQTSAFLQFWEILPPNYDLQSTLLVLFCLHNHFFNPFVNLQCFKLKIDIKIGNIVFLAFIFGQILFLLADLRAPTINLCI